MTYFPGLGAGGSRTAVGGVMKKQRSQQQQEAPAWRAAKKIKIPENRSNHRKRRRSDLKKIISLLSRNEYRSNRKKRSRGELQKKSTFLEEMKIAATTQGIGQK